ncbi:MAG: transcription termination/antitermination protein NusG [Lachnospiraceae bacterium]|nr:transcription termination/antitermination protein NusG [Lachnospiraceae bacterium]
MADNEQKEPHWYVAHTYSGYEKKVKAGIEMSIVNRHLEDRILEVRVPTETKIETKENGQRKEVEKKLFPGYVLVNMVMDDDTWYVVRNTRGVTGFVGPGSKAVPLSDEEMKHLGIHVENMVINFGVGDTVQVVAGPWRDTVGPIARMDNSKRTATLMVELFGRETPVDISFDQLSLLR